MAALRSGWLVGYEDGEYVVYTRHGHSEYATGYETGAEIGRAPVLADALDLADRWERVEALNDARRERERRERVAALSPEDRAELEEHERRRASYCRTLVNLADAVAPMATPLFATRLAAADSLRWRALAEGN